MLAAGRVVSWSRAGRGGRVNLVDTHIHTYTHTHIPAHSHTRPTTTNTFITHIHTHTHGGLIVSNNIKKEESDRTCVCQNRIWLHSREIDKV